MSYSKWVQFVLDSFDWYPGEDHDYRGSITWAHRSETRLPHVGIDILEDQVRITVYYRTTLPYERWMGELFTPNYYSRYDYEKFKREDPSRIAGEVWKEYLICDKDLNLLPWVVGIMKRAKD